jgi:hypothetical protein
VRETAAQIVVSVDDNDAYRMTWYRDGRALGHVDLPRDEAAPGLRVRNVDAPAAARAGYDAIGVLPLFGDGAYALGHLRPLPASELSADRSVTGEAAAGGSR